MSEGGAGFTGKVTSGEERLISRPPDAEGMRRRVEAALAKAERGEELTGRELRIVQWVSGSGGCPVCYGRTNVVVRRSS